MADLALVQWKMGKGFDLRAAGVSATFDDSPTAGNLLFLTAAILKSSGDITFNLPNGFTQIATYDSMVYNGESGLYYRFATEGEGKGFGITNSGAFFENEGMIISEYSGVDGDLPFTASGSWVATQNNDSTLKYYLTATRTGTQAMLYLSWMNFVNVTRTATIGNGFSLHGSVQQNTVYQSIGAKIATDAGEAAATWTWGDTGNRFECGIIGFRGSSAVTPPAATFGSGQYCFNNTVFGGLVNFAIPLEEMPDFYPVGEEIRQDFHISHIGKAWQYDWFRRPVHRMIFNAVGTDTAATLGSLIDQEYAFLFYDYVSNSATAGTGTYIFTGPYRRFDYGPDMCEFDFTITKAD